MLVVCVVLLLVLVAVVVVLVVNGKSWMWSHYSEAAKTGVWALECSSCNECGITFEKQETLEMHMNVVYRALCALMCCFTQPLTSELIG